MAGAKECMDFLTANVTLEESLASADFDCVVVVSTSLSAKSLGKAGEFSAAFEAAAKADAAFEKEVCSVPQRFHESPLYNKVIDPWTVCQII